MDTRSNWTLLAATGLSLGASLPLAKLAVLNGVGPLSFVLLPVLGAGVLLAAIAAVRHGLPRDLARLARFGLAAGALGSALPNAIAAWLAAHAGASIAALAYTLPPVFTLLLSVALRLERVRVPRIAAVMLGLLGAAWLVAGRMAEGQLTLAGALALLAIPGSVGAGNVYRARFLPDAPAEWLGAAMSLGAFTVLLPVWLWSPAAASGLEGQGLPFLGGQALAAALGAVLFFRLQVRADTVTMSFVGYAIALTGVLLGALLLGERLPWQLAPAAGLIAGGFWLIQRHPALQARGC